MSLCLPLPELKCAFPSPPGIPKLDHVNTGAQTCQNPSFRPECSKPKRLNVSLYCSPQRLLKTHF